MQVYFSMLILQSCIMSHIGKISPGKNLEVCVLPQNYLCKMFVSKSKIAFLRPSLVMFHNWLEGVHCDILLTLLFFSVGQYPRTTKDSLCWCTWKEEEESCLKVFFYCQDMDLLSNILFWILWLSDIGHWWQFWYFVICNFANVSFVILICILILVKPPYGQPNRWIYVGFSYAFPGEFSQHQNTRTHYYWKQILWIVGKTSMLL